MAQKKTERSSLEEGYLELGNILQNGPVGEESTAGN